MVDISIETLKLMGRLAHAISRASENGFQEGALLCRSRGRDAFKLLMHRIR
jgi:hypothetical protein